MKSHDKYADFRPHVLGENIFNVLSHYECMASLQRLMFQI